MRIRIDGPQAFIITHSMEDTVRAHYLIEKIVYNFFAYFLLCWKVVTINNFHVNLGSIVEWSKRHGRPLSLTGSESSFRIVEKVNRCIEKVFRKPLSEAMGRDVALIQKLAQDRLHHTNVKCLYDEDSKTLLFKHRFTMGRQDKSYVFHARWAETMVTLGGKYRAKASSGGLHVFENDPHNCPYWGEYSSNHLVRVDGKEFKNSKQSIPERQNGASHIDHKPLHSLDDVVNRFLTRKMTDLLLSAQNEEYYKKQVEKEAELGQKPLEKAPEMSDEAYKMRFHPVTGAGPNRFRAYAQKRRLGSETNEKGTGYKIEASRDADNQLLIRQVKGDPKYSQVIYKAVNEYFPHMAVSLGADNAITLCEKVENVVDDMWKRRIHFGGSFVVDAEGRVQIGKRFGAGFATGGGFSSDFFSKLMSMERDSVDEFGCVGVRPGKFFDLSCEHGTYVGMVDTETLSDHKVGVASDEFDTNSIHFYDIKDLRNLYPFRDAVLNILPKYLDKEAELIQAELQRITSSQNVHVTADKTIIESQKRLGPTWGNLSIQIDGKTYRYIDQNLGKLRKDLAKISSTQEMGAIYTQLNCFSKSVLV